MNISFLLFSALQLRYLLFYYYLYYLQWEKVTNCEMSSQVTKVRNFPRISNHGDFLWRISWKSFPVTDSLEILDKFPRIGPQDERFLWDHIFEIQFWEILRNFSQLNSSEFLQNTSPEIPEKFLGLGHHVYGFLEEFIQELVSRNSWEFLPNFTQKKPENFSWLLLRKFLRNS